MHRVYMCSREILRGGVDKWCLRVVHHRVLLHGWRCGAACVHVRGRLVLSGLFQCGRGCGVSDGVFLLGGHGWGGDVHCGVLLPRRLHGCNWYARDHHRRVHQRRRVQLHVRAWLLLPCWVLNHGWRYLHPGFVLRWQRCAVPIVQRGVLRLDDGSIDGHVQRPVHRGVLLPRRLVEPHRRRILHRGVLLPRRLHCCNWFPYCHHRRVHQRRRMQLCCGVLLPRRLHGVSPLPRGDIRFDGSALDRCLHRALRRWVVRVGVGADHQQLQRALRRRLLLSRRCDDRSRRRDGRRVFAGVLLSRGRE